MDYDRIADIVKLMQAEDMSLAGELFELVHDKIYYQINKTVGDEQLVADLTQDTFVEILDKIKDLKEPKAFVQWSTMIAHHKCTDYFKKCKELLADENEDGWSVFDTTEEDNEEFIPDEALEKDELKKTINAIIDDLPEEQRTAILFRYFNELSVKEIAQIQNVSEGTVKSRLNYGRKAIKESVENYEKKYGIKLRSVGVVPLLLWLFRQYRASRGLSLTATISSATAASATTTAAVATATTAASATTTATVASATSATATASAGGSTIAAVSKTAVVTAKSIVSKKIIAGVVAATVATGGTVAGIMAVYNKPQDEYQIEETTVAATEEPMYVEEIPLKWVGYGEYHNNAIAANSRFEFMVDQMNDTEIKGHLNVSYLYDDRFDTDFTGYGEEKDGCTLYTLSFDKPHQCIDFFGNVKSEKSTLEALYDPEKDTFLIDDHFEVEVQRANTPDPLLWMNEIWTGVGDDSFCLKYGTKDHDYELVIEVATERTLRGWFKLSRDGNVEHYSHFTGRGYKFARANGQEWSYYEIKLETPRTIEVFGWGEQTVDNFWLYYSYKDETYSIQPTHTYGSTMERVK